MEKIKIGWQRINEFSVFGNKYLKQNANTKIAYAINKIAKQTKKFYEDYQSDIDDINIELCFTDKEGVIVYENEGGSRNYKFTKEKAKERKKKTEELQKKWDLKEVEIEPYLAAEIPLLNDIEIECFAGLIIPVDYKNPEKKEEKKEEK